ncbi:MAG: hypothetical protein HY318_00455 [Armatimonadetes bacterium]|nr:hypothetical protein [Armatimonadota bacterium]
MPETVCLTDEGFLVGCLRVSEYMWSDDLGQSWWRIQGIPVLEGGEANPQRYECYQPWMHYLGDGRIACAGHYGGDDPLGHRDQYLNIHLFRVAAQRRARECRILVDRDFDETENVYKNAYTMTLLCDGSPLPGRELEFWYAPQGDPGYDQEGVRPLEARMKVGGTTLKVVTDAKGLARVSVPEMDNMTDRHAHYLVIAGFNADGRDSEYKPAQTPQLLFYALAYQEPPLEPGRNA